MKAPKGTVSQITGTIASCLAFKGKARPTTRSMCFSNITGAWLGAVSDFYTFTNSPKPSQR